MLNDIHYFKNKTDNIPNSKKIKITKGFNKILLK